MLHLAAGVGLEPTTTLLTGGEVFIAETILGADEETRTPDILHGKQVLYQLSYIRICPAAARTS